MPKIIALLNRDNKKKKEYYSWEPINGLELKKVPAINDIIEFQDILYIVDSLSFDFVKNINKVVLKILQQPDKN